MSNSQSPIGSDFVIAPYDMTEIGRSGRGAIRVQVRGCWSYDPITLYVEREFNWSRHQSGEPPVWKCTMSRSSGGRDNDAVKDDLEAETNFGMALIAAAAEGRAILKHAAFLEARYQERMAELKAASEAEEAAKQARIDADQSLGEEKAGWIVDEMIKRSKAQPGVAVIVESFERGEDRVINFSARTDRHSHQTGVFKSSQRISKAEAVRQLAGMSQRARFFAGEVA